MLVNALFASAVAQILCKVLADSAEVGDSLNTLSQLLALLAGAYLFAVLAFRKSPSCLSSRLLYTPKPLFPSTLIHHSSRRKHLGACAFLRGLGAHCRGLTWVDRSILPAT